MNAFTFSGSFFPGSRSTPVDDVDTPRLAALDGVGDVVRRQAAGEDVARPLGQVVDQPPVEQLTRARVRTLDVDEVGREPVRVACIGAAGDDAP